MRVGIGHDTHRLVEGRPLILGGVRIDFPFGLLGHSDADVVMHAVADALLGAAGLGDIGEHFPDTDPKWKGLDGAELLGRGRRPGRPVGWSAVNCDVTVHAQRPNCRPIRMRCGRISPGFWAWAPARSTSRPRPASTSARRPGEAVMCEAVVLLNEVEQPSGRPNPFDLTKPTPMPLRVYNTLSQTKEPFQTVRPGTVGMYVCGPTVYSQSHIGHMVGPVIFDTIKRYLVYLGYQVTWVVNITDVDDKLIVQAQKDGTSVEALAESVTEDYLFCLKALGVDGIDHMPRATEHIAEIIDVTQGLIDKGFAYPSSGDVYFDVTKAPTYGKLSHRDPEELQAGAGSKPRR